MTDSELYQEVMNVDYLTDELYRKMCERCNVNNKPETRPESSKHETLATTSLNATASPEVPRNAKERDIGEGIGDGVGFERIRRITGYLSGDYLSRFNNAKLAEVEDRVKHI